MIDFNHRPAGSNADEWHLFLSEHLDNRANFPNGLTYVAVQIAEAIDAATPADEEARDNLRLIDYIANKIELPETDELSQENFDAWMLRSATPAAGGEADTRFVNCQVCQTEGRILTNGGGPDDVDHGICPECNGERVVEVETNPVTLDDLKRQFCYDHGDCQYPDQL